MIGYIESQRDNYKRSVERLLGRLDPDQTFQEKVDAANAKSNKIVPTVDKASSKDSDDLRVLREIQNHCRRRLNERSITEDSAYRTSPFRCARSILHFYSKNLFGRCFNLISRPRPSTTSPSQRDQRTNTVRSSQSDSRLDGRAGEALNSLDGQEDHVDDGSSNRWARAG